jgi:hypothetical protein
VKRAVAPSDLTRTTLSRNELAENRRVFKDFEMKVRIRKDDNRDRGGDNNSNKKKKKDKPQLEPDWVHNKRYHSMKKKSSLYAAAATVFFVLCSKFSACLIDARTCSIAARRRALRTRETETRQTQDGAEFARGSTAKVIIFLRSQQGT